MFAEILEVTVMREEFVEPDPVLRKKMKLKGEKGKTEKVKETASEKKEEVQEKMGAAKKNLGEKKEEMSSKMHEIKEGASEKKEEIEEDLGEAKEEAKNMKEKFEKKSEEEGRTPAEKLLNDIVKKFRKGSEQKSTKQYQIIPKNLQNPKNPLKNHWWMYLKLMIHLKL